MEKSKINRLIIIGNGFDLNLRLPTSYKDFFCGFVNYIIERRDYFLREPNILFDITSPLREVLRDHDPLLIAKEFLKFKSPLLSIAQDEIEKWNWTDLERIYYSELIRLYKESQRSHFGESPDVLPEVRKLNLELIEIKKFLSDYLLKTVNEHALRLDIDYYYEQFGKPFDKRDFDEATLNQKKDNIQDKIPSTVLILNFNYTKLFKSSFKTAYWHGLDQDFKILNIHGQMENSSSMIFGYGDEFDENYNKLETLDEDDWLRNFKSFSYFKSKEYDKLLGFLELGEFQTWIVGHSCGLSDKTMLNHVFEHENCINLKAYFHEIKTNEGKTDNFDEICFSISRIMKDKRKMRQIVTKKHDGCSFSRL